MSISANFQPWESYPNLVQPLQLTRFVMIFRPTILASCSDFELLSNCFMNWDSDSIRELHDIRKKLCSQGKPIDRNNILLICSDSLRHIIITGYDKFYCADEIMNGSAFKLYAKNGLFVVSNYETWYRNFCPMGISNLSQQDPMSTHPVDNALLKLFRIRLIIILLHGVKCVCFA